MNVLSHKHFAGLLSWNNIFCKYFDCANAVYEAMCIEEQLISTMKAQ